MVRKTKQQEFLFEGFFDNKETQRLIVQARNFRSAFKKAKRFLRQCDEEPCRIMVGPCFCREK